MRVHTHYTHTHIHTHIHIDTYVYDARHGLPIAVLVQVLPARVLVDLIVAVLARPGKEGEAAMVDPAIVYGRGAG